MARCRWRPHCDLATNLLSVGKYCGALSWEGAKNKIDFIVQTPIALCVASARLSWEWSLRETFCYQWNYLLLRERDADRCCRFGFRSARKKWVRFVVDWLDVIDRILLMSSLLLSVDCYCLHTPNTSIAQHNDFMRISRNTHDNKFPSKRAINRANKNSFPSCTALSLLLSMKIFTSSSLIRSLAVNGNGHNNISNFISRL